MKKLICLYLTLVMFLTGCGNLKSQIKGNSNIDSSADQPTGNIIASDNTGIIEKQEKRESGSGNNIGNTGDNPNGVNGNENNQNGDNPNGVNGNGNNQNGDNNKPQLPDDGKGLLKDSAKWLGDHKGIALGIAAGIAVIGAIGFRGQPNFCAVNYFYVPQGVINQEQEQAVQENQPPVQENEAQNLNQDQVLQQQIQVLRLQYQQQQHEIGELFAPELLNTESAALEVMLSALQTQLTQQYQLQEQQLQEQLLQYQQLQEQEQEQLIQQLLQQQLLQRLTLAQQRQGNIQIQIAGLRRFFQRRQVMPFRQLEYLNYQHQLIQQLLQPQQQLQYQQQQQLEQQLEELLERIQLRQQHLQQQLEELPRQLEEQQQLKQQQAV